MRGFKSPADPRVKIIGVTMTLTPRQTWAIRVLELDPECRCGCGRRATDPHHIIHKSLGGKDYLWNGIGLWRVCHDKAQGRCNAYVNGKRVTARQYMIHILSMWKHHRDFRWAKAYEILCRKEGVE